MLVDRHAEAVSAIRHALLGSPGATDGTARERAFLGGGDSELLAVFVAKVQEASYRVSDKDLEALKVAGFSEDAIFELTLAAAVGAASRRLGAGLRALGEAS